MTPPIPVAPSAPGTVICPVCKQTVSANGCHRCLRCDKVLHAFCGTQAPGHPDGHGARRICTECQAPPPKQSSAANECDPAPRSKTTASSSNEEMELDEYFDQWCQHPSFTNLIAAMQFPDASPRATSEAAPSTQKSLPSPTFATVCDDITNRDHDGRNCRKTIGWAAQSKSEDLNQAETPEPGSVSIYVGTDPDADMAAAIALSLMPDEVPVSGSRNNRPTRTISKRSTARPKRFEHNALDGSSEDSSAEDSSAEDRKITWSKSEDGTAGEGKDLDDNNCDHDGRHEKKSDDEYAESVSDDEDDESDPEDEDDESALPGDRQTWVSCDNCEKWRRVAHEPEADNWRCSDNPDTEHITCSVPQEKTDEPIELEMIGPIYDGVTKQWRCPEGSSEQWRCLEMTGPIYDGVTKQWRCPEGSSEAYMEKWALFIVCKEDCEGQSDPDFSDKPRAQWFKRTECPYVIEFAKTAILTDDGAKSRCYLSHAGPYDRFPFRQDVPFERCETARASGALRSPDGWSNQVGGCYVVRRRGPNSGQLCTRLYCTHSGCPARRKIYHDCVRGSTNDFTRLVCYHFRDPDVTHWNETREIVIEETDHSDTCRRHRDKVNLKKSSSRGVTDGREPRSLDCRADD